MNINKLIEQVLTKMIVALFFATSLPVSVQATETIQVIVSDWMVELYKNKLSEHQNDALNITGFNFKGVPQQFVSLIIIKQALHKGGISVDFDFVVSPNSTRSFSLLRKSEAVLMPMLIYNDAIPNDLLASSPIIPSKSALRGIYGLKSNKSLMTVTTLEQLQQHSAVISVAWKQDVSILKQLNLKSVETVSLHATVYTRVAFRNTDFTLLDFTFSNEHIKQFGDITLYAVPNVAIEVKGSKHFVFSKSHPHSKIILQAFEKGLAIMQKEGIIAKYYQQVGLIRTDLEHLKILNK